MRCIIIPKVPKERLKHGIKNGYRSGLEERIAAELDKKNVKYEYESVKIPFIPPQKQRTYTPDIILPNGLIVELKGRFVTADRMKHRYIKQQYPNVEIRFVFQRASQKINKGSKTTYGSWCNQYGFKYAEGFIPQEWLDEPPHKENLRFLKELKGRKNDTKGTGKKTPRKRSLFE